MSNIDKQELREAAEKATLGPWRAFRYDSGICGVSGGESFEILVCERISSNRPEDAKFIAAANPATMLTLLDELEAKDKRIAELERKDHNSERQDVIDQLCAAGEPWEEVQEYMQKWDAERAAAAGKGE